MNIIELNHIDLNSIGLNSKTINGVGEPSVRKKETFRILDNLAQKITDLEGNKITYK